MDAGPRRRHKAEGEGRLPLATGPAATSAFWTAFARMDAGLASPATDLVEWRLYLDGAESPSEEALRGVLATCAAQVAPVLRDYIWQRDPFTLRILDDERGDGARCLGGAAHVGESLEDEWLAAWLCFHLTGAVPGLTARYVASGGRWLQSR